MPLGERAGEVVGLLRWRFQRGPIPPGLGPYTKEPWVVSNGRLRRHGWTPTVTNEQAYVEATEAPWWTTISPKRRQEITLGLGVVAGVALAVVGGGADAADRRCRSVDEQLEPAAVERREQFAAVSDDDRSGRRVEVDECLPRDVVGERGGQHEDAILVVGCGGGHLEIGRVGNRGGGNGVGSADGCSRRPSRRQVRR